MLNLTPCPIQVGSITYQPSGIVARVATIETEIDTYIGIPVIRRTNGEPVNVPTLPCEPFLVSAMVLSALPEAYRGTAFAPDTGATAIRDETGHIKSFTRLVTV